MRKTVSALVLGLLLGASPAALLAQDAVPADSNRASPLSAIDDESEDIVVNGARPRGSVLGDIQPEQELSPADIRSYGVSTVSELLNELAPQTNAGGGAPVVLLNGKRISGYSEVQDLPAEAIARVEVLPEDVSLQYGYAANQKVVNIVLRRRFRAYLGELRGGATTEFDRENGQVSASMLRIQNDNRLNLDIKYSAAASLLESDRNIDPTAPSRPYSLIGNILPGSGLAQIDPALSALAGTPVTSAAVPSGASSGIATLTDFVAGANSTSLSDLGKYRTLSPSTSNLAVNAVLARPLTDSISASFNARVERTQSDSLQGLPSLALTLPVSSPFSPFADPVQLYRYLDQAGALGQSVKSTNAHLGMTLNGEVAAWQWSLTAGYDRNNTRTSTDRGIDPTAIQSALAAGNATVNPFGAFTPALLSTRLADSARAKSSALTGDLLLSGALFDLPAGKVTSSVTLSGSASDYDSRSIRSGVARSVGFSRDIVGAQANVDIPITSRRNGILDAIGDLSLNGNAAVQHLSDFGTLTSVGYGLHWTPIPAIRFIASVSNDKTAPNGQQINNPQVATPNVPIFDYATGQTVFVAQIGGGNTGLIASERHRLRLGLTIKPFDKPDITLTANYTHSRTDNPIASFPTPTPQIEAAFPDRFIRDADGTLLQIDARPINFAQSRSSQLRWGVNFSMAVKSHLQKQFEAWRAAGAKPEDRPADLRALFGQRDGARPGAGEGGQQPGGETRNETDRSRQNSGGLGAAGADGPRAVGAGPGGPGGGFGGGGFRGGGGPGGRNGGGRLQFALYHTWHFTESVLIAPGLPRLDLLDGDATGSNGGQPRHELQAQAGYTNNGIGTRLSANWQSATRVNGALDASNSTLRFSSLATVDLRLFANLGQMPQLVKGHPFLRGSRVSLSIDNLFNSRQSVSNGTGATPLRYQPGYLDPLGRTFTISFRKLFF